METQIANPYSDNRFIGYVSMVSPLITKIHFPSSLLLKKFFFAEEGFHAIVGSYVVIEGAGTGFLAKITDIALPEKERLDLSESKFEKQDFHPTGKVEILLCFDNYELKAKKGLDQLPPVSAKVFLCSDDFLRKLLQDFGKKENIESTMIPLATLPHDLENDVNVSAQALFGRHCAVVGTTGGGKSWTVAKLIEDQLTLFYSRADDYYQIDYKTNVYAEEVPIINSDLISRIKNNKLYETIDDINRYKNIIIKHFNSMNITLEDVKALDNIDYFDNIELFYNIPMIIFILEYYIRGSLSSNKDPVLTPNKTVCE